MAFNLTLLNSGKQTTKDYIITLLGSDWPLTAKRLHNLMKKRYAYGATYQAVYKTLNQLVEDGVVTRKKDGYELNLKWLKELHRYTEAIETNYYTKNRLNLIEGIKDSRSEGNINILTFETYFDVEKYLYYLQKHHILSSRKKEAICVHHSHEWRPLFYLRAEYNWVHQTKEKGHDTYVLCAGKTPIDRWCANFYRSIGAKIRTGANCASTSELMVFGEMVIQIYVPSQISAELDKVFSKSDLIHDVDTKMLIENVFEKKTDIKVIINRDLALADQLRNDTLKQFR